MGHDFSPVSTTDPARMTPAELVRVYEDLCTKAATPYSVSVERELAGRLARLTPPVVDGTVYRFAVDPLGQLWKRPLAGFTADARHRPTRRAGAFRSCIVPTRS